MYVTVTNVLQSLFPIQKTSKDFKIEAERITHPHTALKIEPSRVAPIGSQCGKPASVAKRVIPKEPEKSAFGLGQSPYNRRSQVGSYCINTDQLAKPAVVDSRELSLKSKNRFFRFFGYTSFLVPRFRKVFQNINSTQLLQLVSNHTIAHREDFLKSNFNTPPPFIGKSSFVSRQMVEHLMRDKKNLALGVKYQPGDKITNMEGALHTFVTPLCHILMTGDYLWKGQAVGKNFGNNKVRPVILSAAINPNFETKSVMMPLVSVCEKSIEGKPFDLTEIPPCSSKDEIYESNLQKLMIYHLSPDHRLPALCEIAPRQILNPKQAESLLESTLNLPPSNSRPLKGLFMRYKDYVISLEILYHVYIEQIQNEFKILNSNIPQGYIYTINPPSFFAKELGGSAILNRLQMLAYKKLARDGLFSNMKVLAYNNYADPKMVRLFQKVLPHVNVISQYKLYDPDGPLHKRDQKIALVLHNNSDAFGQNIEFEETSSQDGMIGSFSNAACALKRDRADLVDFIY